MSQRNTRRSVTRTGSIVHTSAQELSSLVQMSRGIIVKLTGPSFPDLPPEAAGLVLMFVAHRMPKDLRIRTMHLGVNLIRTGDWSSEIVAAARQGDPIAQALADAIIIAARARLESMPLQVGGVVH